MPEGYWFDRTRESAARRRGETFGRYEYATAETVELDPLPCWKHLPVEEQHRRVASLVRSIDEQAAARRHAAGIRSLGVAAVLAQNPCTVPVEVPGKSPGISSNTVHCRRIGMKWLKVTTLRTKSIVQEG